MTHPSRLRRTAVAALIALALPVTLAEPASASSDPAYYTVLGSTGPALERQGYDVLEGPRAGGVPVLADGAEVARLRGRGLTVRYDGPLYQAVPLTVAAGTFYGGYHTSAGHEAHNAEVAAAHPDLAKLYAIGQSWRKTQGSGGHDIQALCITKIKPGDCSLTSTGTKPKFTLMSQMHAR